MQIIYNKNTGVVFDALQDSESVVRNGVQLIVGSKVYAQGGDYEHLTGVTVPSGWLPGKYCYNPENGQFELNVAWGELYYTTLTELENKYTKLTALLVDKNVITADEVTGLEE